MGLALSAGWSEAAALTSWLSWDALDASRRVVDAAPSVSAATVLTAACTLFAVLGMLSLKESGKGGGRCACTLCAHGECYMQHKMHPARALFAAKFWASLTHAGIMLECC